MLAGKTMIHCDDYLISGSELAEICKMSHRDMLEMLWGIFGMGWDLFDTQSGELRSRIDTHSAYAKRNVENVNDYYLNMDHFQIVACLLTPEQKIKATTLLCKKLSNFARDRQISEDTRQREHDEALKWFRDRAGPPEDKMRFTKDEARRMRNYNNWNREY